MLKRDIAKARIELAEYLTLRYAPGVQFRLVPGGVDRIFIAEGMTEGELIYNPQRGLTTLLHELGHWATRKQAAQAKSVLEDEALAWAWAEKCARRENLWFDYSEAERCFEAHKAEQAGGGQRVPVRIEWRWR
jgi:hypothetical protein